MQTRRNTRGSEHAGAESKAVKPRRASKKPRLSPPPSQPKVQEKAPAHTARGRKSTSQLPSTPHPRKGVKKAELSSTALSQDKAKGHDESGKKEMQDKISINRAPVLTLWVAIAATREGYTYEEGLSFGKAIAGLLAQSKGRSLGIYEEASEEKKEERKRKRKEFDKLPVFGMNVLSQTTSDGRRLALQSGKQIVPATVASYLHRSFGANLDRAKGAMEDLANSFSPEEVGKAAYSLYEKFRPTVSHGVKGWGAKGVLDLEYLHTLRSH